MTPLTPDEYRSALKSLGLTQNEAGRFFGVHEVTARNWARKGPPATVDKFLRLMLALRFTPAYVDQMVGDGPS